MNIIRTPESKSVKNSNFLQWKCLNTHKVQKRYNEFPSSHYLTSTMLNTILTAFIYTSIYFTPLKHFFAVCLFQFGGFFGHNHKACGILALQPGIKPVPPQWKHRVLTTGPPQSPSNRYFKAKPSHSCHFFH